MSLSLPSVTLRSARDHGREEGGVETPHMLHTRDIHGRETNTRVGGDVKVGTSEGYRRVWQRVRSKQRTVTVESVRLENR